MQDFAADVYKILASEIKKAGGNKKKLILAGGVLAYEPSADPITEESPLVSHALFPSRNQVKKDLFANEDVYGTLVAPSSVYGGEGGNYSKFFVQAEQGKVIVFGTGNMILSNVHVEDVAQAYALIAEAEPHLVDGQTFNVGEDKKRTYLEVAQAFALAAGYKGQIETGAPFPFILSDTTRYFDCSKAKRVLGWKPSRTDIVLEAPALYQSWKALGKATSML
eukprot:TRINITY_DN1134_c0_g1_i1.p1 TRINITY_DN1134_c0_g1~~TRINITY_DN1134_c0_g1_i1.p1  ORF type:complete len:222 (-),score=47.76 TRINITY_DN1134_c0_g1_i1:148-813(-)